MNDLEKDKNYKLLRAVYTALELHFDEESAPTEVLRYVHKVTEILDDACRFYECADEADHKS